MVKFDTVLFAGFFDRVHEGHVNVFTYLKGLDCEKVLILVGSNKRVRKKGKELIKISQSESTRLKAVKSALGKLGITSKSRVLLYDNWPPKEAINAGSRDAMVFDSEKISFQKIRVINQLRKGKGMSPLKVLIKERSKSISSTQIRRNLHSLYTRLAGVIKNESAKRTRRK